jgi:predicted lipase
MYLCPEFEKAGSCPKGKYCPYPHKSIVKRKASAQKCASSADETCVATAGSEKRKRYCEREETISVEFGTEPQNLQVSSQVDSSDLNSAGSSKRKRYFEMEKAISVEFGTERQNMQVSSQVDSSDLKVERLKVLKETDDMNDAWQNDQCNSTGQMDTSPDLLPESEQPKVKRCKLGILPAYIPLG